MCAPSTVWNPVERVKSLCALRKKIRVCYSHARVGYESMEIEEDNDAWCFLAHPFSLSPTTVAAATGVRCTASPAEGGKPRRMEELRSCSRMEEMWGCVAPAVSDLGERTAPLWDMAARRHSRSTWLKDYYYYGSTWFATKICYAKVLTAKSWSKKLSNMRRWQSW